jgi:phosphatidylinositol N-acetylglucosaminyltransferase subunit Q
MVRHDGLLRIFWPSDAPRTQKHGVIVGWRNSELDIFVVSILQDVEVHAHLNPAKDLLLSMFQARNVEKALQGGLLYRNSPHSIDRMFQLCSQLQMSVLGTLNPRAKPTVFDASHLYLFLDRTSWHPFVLCPTGDKMAVQTVVYRRPSPVKMQYMSLDPISLVLGDKSFRDSEDDGKLETIRRQKLSQKLRLHTVIKHVPSHKETFLPSIIDQINCSRELDHLLLKNVHLIGARQRRTLSVNEIIAESASTIWDYLMNILWVWIWPIILKTFKVGLICHRLVAEIILRILEWRIRANSAALKDISATAQQFDIRLQQFCYWPIQYTTLQKRKRDWHSVTDSHPDYIRFYNSLWLVANDVIIGIALGTYIIENADWVATSLNYLLSVWTVTGVERMIRWLTDWPAGLKLNNELASFLGDLFLWVIQYWSQCLDNIRPMIPALIYFVGFSSFAGASMPIALFSDLLSLLTLHIYSFYIASARIYHWQLTIIISLFHLFRGKKHNVLRNRIDSCDYDLDQLLLGTILFTLLAFLLPTVLVFYFAFALSRMVIISIMAILDTALACLNHFPLFALMLRIKDSRRLPGLFIGSVRSISSLNSLI